VLRWGCRKVSFEKNNGKNIAVSNMHNHLVEHMARLFFVTALASILVLSGYAQDICCSQPMVIQVNSDGTHSTLINVHNTPIYIDTQNGAVSLIPCNPVFTYDFATNGNQQPDFAFSRPARTSQDSSRRSSERAGYQPSMRSPDHNLKGISFIHTQVQTNQRFVKTTMEEPDIRNADQNQQ
jgi:hypothetical protein